MMEERYHATTQNRFYPDVSNVEFQLEELFSAVKNSITARCLNRTSENSSI